MSDQTPTFTTDAVDWSDIGYQLAHGIAKRVIESDSTQWLKGTLAEKEALVMGAVWDTVVYVAGQAGILLHKIEEPAGAVIAPFVLPIIQGLFGAEADPSLFARRMAQGSGATAAQSVVAGFMKAIVGDAGGGPVEPGPEGATRIAGAAVGAALESTFNAVLFETLTDLIPEFGHWSEFTRIPEEIIDALGVSRLVRTALRPLVNATAATPMDWYAKKTYRPTLLPDSTAARQWTRGRWEWNDVVEELARKGYSDERIDAIINEQLKVFSPSDVRLLEYRGFWTQDQATQHLRDQGYDDDGASTALRIEGLKQIQSLEDSETSAIVSAYANRLIDDAELGAALSASVSVDADRALATELARVKRAMNIKRMTSSQVESCVTGGILAVPDYRAALEREGYPPEDVDALELLLRKKLDDQAKVEQLRAQQAADKTAAAQAKADAQAAALAKQKAAATLAAQGSESSLEQAYIRGLIPIERVQEVYSAKYDADTVGILTSLLEQKRQDYVAQQQKAAAAAAQAPARGLAIGALQDAVRTGVLTLDQYRARLEAAGYAAADVDVLVSTMSAQLAATAAAQRARDAAAAAAAKKGLSLTQWEMLVRKGHRSMAEYDAVLASLGYDAGARAGIEQLLQDKIDEDAQAAAARQAAAAQSTERGLSLEQARNAVIIGAQPMSWFSEYLANNKYALDAQTVLVAELQASVDEANAARQRRKQTPAPTDARTLPLSTVERAARLGIITPEAYQARLEAAGYSADDVAIDMDLLVAEIAATRDAQHKAGSPPIAPVDKSLSLSAVADAVKRGVKTLGDYTAAALAQGYSQADAQTLTDVLSAEVSTLTAAKELRNQVAFDLAAAGLSLDALEQPVKDGSQTVADYVAELQAYGYTADQAQLLGNLLLFTMQAAASKGSPGGGA